MNKYIYTYKYVSLYLYIYKYIYTGWWFEPSEKYSSIGMIIPNIWENKKMFQTTNQYIYI